MCGPHLTLSLTIMAPAVMFQSAIIRTAVTALLWFHTRAKIIQIFLFVYKVYLCVNILCKNVLNSIFSFEKCIFGKKIWFHEFSRVLRILIKLHSENRIPLTQELEIEARVEVQNFFFCEKRSYIFYIILEYLVTIFGIDFANSYFSKRPPPAPPPTSSL